MSKNLVLIFTRNPEIGKVKTRLAKTIGNEAALAIYKFLLEHTKNVALEVPYDKAVYYSVKIRTADLWEPENFQKFRQEGADLGERMQAAFQRGFDEHYDKVLIIGSDLYDLKPSHIEAAFQALDNHDAVIGPAEDGGYYLLGLKKMYSSLFSNKEWGTSTVRQDTLKDLENVSVHLLETLNDIDVFEDIQNRTVFNQFYTKN
ncbi:conserved hypothetical protein [Tenacibaculum litopenaei]|jgi:rSAM/selenodomain-associated transferase 1|uniref:TIGR04282 family arsenosugar biosynthesis glycosyltransferase n=1 Tax=Tenacibaculum litopenaei TaxID=396016 RepID=UPI0038961B85